MQNTENEICSSPVGTAIFGLTHRPDLRVDFFVREESEFIDQITTAKISLPLRARLFKRDDIALLLIMFQLGSIQPRLYETFWNYHLEGDYGEKIFRLISVQDDIAFHLYGDSGAIEKSILMHNSFKGFFGAAINKIKDMPVWSSEQFGQALKELRRIYPSKEAFWDALK
jgi:hypothetical protein